MLATLTLIDSITAVMWSERFQHTVAALSVVGDEAGPLPVTVTDSGGVTGSAMVILSVLMMRSGAAMPNDFRKAAERGLDQVLGLHRLRYNNWYCT